MTTRNEFSAWLSATFQEYRAAPKELTCEAQVKRLELMPHQEFVRDYLQHRSPYRGLLVYHGLGSGKTCTAIATAEGLLSADRMVSVLLPASLRTNFQKEIGACGDPILNWKAFQWKFSKKRNPYKVSELLRREMGGVWIPRSDQPSNASQLRPQDVAQIEAQLKELVDTRYTFVHYNGLDTKALKQLTNGGKTNPFDHRTVVIDEAHNLISGVSNGAPIMSALYDLVLKAADAKVVLLSGTPLINHPFEVALLINLVKGGECGYVASFEKDVAGSQVEKAFLEHPRVDTFETFVKDTRTHARFTLLPPEFAYAAKTTDRVKRSKTPAAVPTLEELETALRKATKSKKVQVTEDSRHLPFPTTMDAFEKFFIDEKEGAMRNKDLFVRRALGAVSFFAQDDPRLYPAMRYHDMRIPMSDYQFEKYVDARKQEHKQEARASYNRGTFAKMPSVYKAYSRAICNFAFPSGVERPRPKDIDFVENSADKKTEYGKALDTALGALKKSHLTQQLSTLSPKFAKCVELVKESPGPVLIYSQFRKVEGVELMARALQYHDFTEMAFAYKDGAWSVALSKKHDPSKPCFAKLRTDVSLSPEKRSEFNTILLGIFNNDMSAVPQSIATALKERGTSNLRGAVLKVLFITQSGAEGISLKNVRQVHVLEPYWNKNRIEQVIGRARRMCSHEALPPSERTCDVYTYTVCLTDAQMAQKIQTVFVADKNRTTDEQIEQIADRKARILKEFKDAVQSASVDCDLNGGLECFRFPAETFKRKHRAFTIRIEDDFSTTAKRAKQTLREGVFILTIKRPVVRKFIYVQTTGELLDYQLYQTSNTILPRGSATPLDDLHYRFVLFDDAP